MSTKSILSFLIQQQLLLANPSKSTNLPFLHLLSLIPHKHNLHYFSLTVKKQTLISTSKGCLRFITCLFSAHRWSRCSHNRTVTELSPNCCFDIFANPLRQERSDATYSVCMHTFWMFSGDLAVKTSKPTSIKQTFCLSLTQKWRDTFHLEFSCYAKPACEPNSSVQSVFTWSSEDYWGYFNCKKDTMWSLLDKYSILTCQLSSVFKHSVIFFFSKTITTVI